MDFWMNCHKLVLFREWGSMSCELLTREALRPIQCYSWRSNSNQWGVFIITSNHCLKVWSQADIMPFNPHVHLGLALTALLFTDPLGRRAELLSVSATIWISIPRQHPVSVWWQAVTALTLWTNHFICLLYSQNKQLWVSVHADVHRIQCCHISSGVSFS